MKLLLLLFIHRMASLATSDYVGISQPFLGSLIFENSAGNRFILGGELVAGDAE
jgi:hypothetical protein